MFLLSSRVPDEACSLIGGPAVVPRYFPASALLPQKVLREKKSRSFALFLFSSLNAPSNHHHQQISPRPPIAIELQLPFLSSSQTRAGFQDVPARPPTVYARRRCHLCDGQSRGRKSTLFHPEASQFHHDGLVATSVHFPVHSRARLVLLNWIIDAQRSFLSSPEALPMSSWPKTQISDIRLTCALLGFRPFRQTRNAAPAFNAASIQARSYADAKASPTEVSSILEQRIRGVQEEADLAETGRVLSVG